MDVTVAGKRQVSGSIGGRYLTYALLALYAVVSIFPFYWTLISSLKDSNDILMHTVRPPLAPKWENYLSAWVQGSMGMYFFNTVLVSCLPVVVVLVTSAMAAYVLARVRPSFLLYTYFVLGIMIPVQVMLLPELRLIKLLDLVSTRTGLMLVFVAVSIPQAIFILYGFMKDIPHELEEAAMMEGCRRPRMFFSIVFPVCRPALATTGILTLIFCWNDYLIPLVLISKKENNVLSLALRSLQSEFIIDYGVLSAGIIISVLPVILLYVLFQEQVVKGMTSGAVKG